MHFPFSIACGDWLVISGCRFALKVNLKPKQNNANLQGSNSRRMGVLAERSTVSKDIDIEDVCIELEVCLRFLSVVISRSKRAQEYFNMMQ